MFDQRKAGCMIDPDWLISVIEKFKENGFDMKTTSFVFDKKKIEHIKEDTKQGQTLLDAAVLNCGPKIIEYLCKSGLKFEDSKDFHNEGIHGTLKKFPKHSRVEKFGANVIQYIIARAYAPESDYDEGTWQLKNQADYFATISKEERDKLIDEKDADAKTKKEEDEKRSVRHRQYVFELVECCVKNGYPLTLQDLHGFTLRDYIIKFTSDDQLLFKKYMDLLK